MNDIDINSEYFSDKPHSYGGKYRLYELYNKDDVDTALTNNNIYKIQTTQKV